MNKKLIKTIASITCGLGIAASIPFTIASCGSSSEGDVIPSNALPYEVYEIDETTNVLKGFKEDVDLSQYDGICDTMQIPSKVTSIADQAFYNTSATTIPSFIANLTFAKGSSCSTIETYAFGLSPLTSATLPDGLTTIGDATFAYSKLTSITLPSVLKTIGSGAFASCGLLTSIAFPSSLTRIGNNSFANSKLNNIEWILPRNYQSSITIVDYAFYRISSTGTVKSLNTSVASSQELLDWIKGKGNFPSTGWTVAA